MKITLRHITVFLFLVIIIVAACERKADIDFPPHKPLLVLHGYVSVGDTMMIALGKTMKVNVLEGDTATYVDNGWVVLYVNDVFADTMAFDPVRRKYVSSHVTAQTGKTYKVRAGAPGFGEVEGVATAPVTVPTQSIEVKDSVRSTLINTLLSDISFSFIDPPSENNHYLLELFYPYGFTNDCVYTYEPAIERYKGELVPFDENSCIYNHEVLFNDRSFNGQYKKLTISARTDALKSYVDPLTGKTMRSYLKRHNISEDYYRYFKTWMAIEFNTGTATTASPVIIRGNIRNGYGLFTVFSTVTDTLP